MGQRILPMPAWETTLPPGYGAIRILRRRRRAGGIGGAVLGATGALAGIGIVVLLLIVTSHAIAAIA